MIRRCTEEDFETVYHIINDASIAYKGVIPGDCWHEPYMTEKELRNEIESGVIFYGYEQQGDLAGVMGIQDVRDVTLFRHAYVRTALRNHGIGGKLLSFLHQQAKFPVLVGTWAAATWAVRFYEKHGFRQVSIGEKNCLLRTYWSISERQTETSIVLADGRWFAERGI